MVDPDYMMIPRPADPLEAAIRYFGSQSALAEAAGYTPQAITMWRQRGRVPGVAARVIEFATYGQCPAESFKDVEIDL